MNQGMTEILMSSGSPGSCFKFNIDKIFLPLIKYRGYSLNIFKL